MSVRIDMTKNLINKAVGSTTVGLYYPTRQANGCHIHRGIEVLVLVLLCNGGKRISLIPQRAKGRLSSWGKGNSETTTPGPGRLRPGPVGRLYNLSVVTMHGQNLRRVLVCSIHATSINTIIDFILC